MKQDNPIPQSSAPASQPIVPEPQPVPCPACTAPCFVRENGTVVAHWTRDDEKCRGNEKLYAELLRKEPSAPVGEQPLTVRLVDPTFYVDPNCSYHFSTEPFVVAEAKPVEEELPAMNGNQTKPVSDLLNSMKVVDRSQRYMECRSDVLTKLMYELVAARLLAAKGGPLADKSGRYKCVHCGIRIYPEWRHHASNMKPCYGGRDTEAEPVLASSPAAKPALLEQIQQLNEPQDYWRCFHCDFYTRDHAEAGAHFGDRDDAEEFKPICKWWARMDDTERKHEFQQAVHDLNYERMEAYNQDKQIGELRSENARLIAMLQGGE